VRTLKDLLRAKETAVIGQETTVPIKSIHVPPGMRGPADPPPLELAADMVASGMRHPVTVWTDGTLISGSRRLRALLVDDPGTVRAIVVDNIEDAAKRLLNDNSDEHLSVPMKPSEICHLWAALRKLDEPAAAARLTAARRRGVELRKQTTSGQRSPGRAGSRGTGDEYLMSVIGEPFGYAEATASRLWTVYSVANNPSMSDERRSEARTALQALDEGRCSIWAAYSAIVRGRKVIATRPKSAAAGPAPASRQTAAWARSLPQLEGLITGLVELGPPNPALTWDQVGPVHARLAKARRDLEKIIKTMKETAQS